MNTFDRYYKFRNDGGISIIPFIPIVNKSTDVYETYIHGESRLDLLSQQYYNNPNYGWLILQANPKYGSMEFEIPNYSQLRIPFPLNTTLSMYQTSIDDYLKKYDI